MKFSIFNFQFSIKLNEAVFFLAGVAMLISVPALDSGGFYLWGAVKLLYLSAVVIYVWNRNI
jgi:hypothetical protein